MDRARGSGAIGFTNDLVSGDFVNVAMLCCRQSEKKPAKAPQKYGRGMEPKTGKKCSGTYSRSAAQLAGTRAETQQSVNPKKQTCRLPIGMLARSAARIMAVRSTLTLPGPSANGNLPARMDESLAFLSRFPPHGNDAAHPGHLDF
jgi:hypothetical protein